MRLAIVQMHCDGKGRAGALQRLVGAIQEAAGAVPPPDLIALPGACDTGGAAVRGRHLSDAYLAAVRETLAWKAREWGVYLAAGLHARRHEAIVPYAVLFDPDGDIVRATIDVFSTAEERIPRAPVAGGGTPIGDVVVLDASAVPDPASLGAAGPRLVVVCGHDGTPVAARRRWSGLPEALAAAGGDAHSWWALVGWSPGEAEKEKAGYSSVLLDARGHAVVQTDGAGERVLFADIELSPADVLRPGQAVKEGGGPS